MIHHDPQCCKIATVKHCHSEICGFCSLQALLTEIEDYRDTIEQVTDKGRDLLESNPRVPELRQQVDSEIKNLEESYMNLQATAVQIKVRICHYKSMIIIKIYMINSVS